MSQTSAEQHLAKLRAALSKYSAENFGENDVAKTDDESKTEDKSDDAADDSAAKTDDAATTDGAATDDAKAEGDEGTKEADTGDKEGETGDSDTEAESAEGTDPEKPENDDALEDKILDAELEVPVEVPADDIPQSQQVTNLADPLASLECIQEVCGWLSAHQGGMTNDQVNTVMGHVGKITQGLDVLPKSVSLESLTELPTPTLMTRNAAYQKFDNYLNDVILNVKAKK